MCSGIGKEQVQCDSCGWRRELGYVIDFDYITLFHIIDSHQSARTFTTIKLMTDKVFRAVIAANKALEKYKYHVVGGAAGTVSPSK